MLRFKVPPGGVVSARGMGCRCRRAAAGLPAVPLGSSCGKCSQGTMRRHASPLARHNRAICTQTTEPAIKPTQVNIRRSDFLSEKCEILRGDRQENLTPPTEP